MKESNEYPEFDEEDQAEIQLLLKDPQAFRKRQEESEKEVEEFFRLHPLKSPIVRPRRSPWQRAKAFLFSLFA
jgi:hypothetical protein